MTLEELISQMIKACDELDAQSIDYSRTSSLLSALNKLIECYQKKCSEADDKTLDDICFLITIKLEETKNNKASEVLKELYSFTVEQMNSTLGKNDAENKALN